MAVPRLKAATTKRRPSCCRWRLRCRRAASIRWPRPCGPRRAMRQRCRQSASLRFPGRGVTAWVGRPLAAARQSADDGGRGPGCARRRTFRGSRAHRCRGRHGLVPRRAGGDRLERARSGGSGRILGAARLLGHGSGPGATRKPSTRLREMGIMSVMLTGDGEGTARRVAEVAGFDRMLSGHLARGQGRPRSMSLHRELRGTEPPGRRHGRATGSTMRRRWPRPTSASQWGAAPMLPSRRPGITLMRPRPWPWWRTPSRSPG